MMSTRCDTCSNVSNKEKTNLFEQSEDHEDSQLSDTQGVPLMLHDRPIYVVSSSEYFESLVKDYSLLEESVVGYDAEWTKDSDLSIVQLTFSCVNIIIQIEQLNPELLPSLKTIMESDKILKTGVGIGEDIHKLIKHMRIDMACGVVDIVKVAQYMGYNELKTSLQHLTERYLHIQITKDPAIRCGNWSAPTLNHDQIMYAAGDSYYSREVFMCLYEEHNRQEEKSGSVLDWVVDNDWVKSISYHNEDIEVKLFDSKGSYYSTISANRLPKRKKSPYSSRNTPVYENCKLLAPDGFLLCRIGKRKLDWYVKRGLGTIVCEDPYTVQLRFEPKSRTPTDVIQLSGNDNLCVVCGNRSDYVSHSILPHRYRKFLPEQWKSHNNRDNVVLCIECNARCNKYDDIYSQKMIEFYGFRSKSVPLVLNCDVYTAKKAAAVVLKIYRRIISPPNSRKIQLEESVLSFLQKYNPAVWLKTIDDEKKAKTNELVSEKVFARIEEECEEEMNEDGYEFDDNVIRRIMSEKKKDDYESPSEMKEETVVNPFAGVVLNEAMDYHNFDESLLEKMTELSAFTIDLEYVPPEEKVMKLLLSSANSVISFVDETNRSLNTYDAISDFIIGWRKNFVEKMQPHFLRTGWTIDSRLSPLRDSFWLV